MKYQLVKAAKEDTQLLEKYKEQTILEYAQDLTNEEREQIKKYIQENVPKDIQEYYKILVNNKVVGCLLVKEKDNSVFLDELYLEENYRRQGIGSDILKNITEKYDCIGLWVYKNNTRAILLYQRMGFKILDETQTRYYMEYRKEEQV